MNRKRIKIPYNRSFLEAELPEERLAGIFESKLPESDGNETGAVKNALALPIGSAKLSELSKGKRSAVVISSDHTRPVPSRVIMPHILEELRKGSPDIDITILIATGFHRATTREELIGKFGEEIVTSEKIVVHDSLDKNSLVKLGTLPSGGELIINKLAVETELLVAEGFIEPHFFAGFSGGRKSVLPGIASAETVLANHCSEFIQSPSARTGNLENNPIHCDMLFAAEQAKLAFIVNVILDHKKRVIKAFAGDSVKAHLAGCEYLKSKCQAKVPESDIVITSNGGYPLDQNIYQAVKGMTAAEAACHENGVIIMVSSCCDGHGGESFYENMASAHCPFEVLKKTAAVPRNKTAPDQWEFQILARVLSKHKVIMVSSDCDPGMIKAMHMEHAFTLDEAIERAFSYMGKNAKVSVIPDGVSVIVEKETV